MIYDMQTWRDIPQWRGMLLCPLCNEPFGDCDGVESHPTEALRAELWKAFHPEISFEGFTPDTGMAEGNMDIEEWTEHQNRKLVQRHREVVRPIERKTESRHHCEVCEDNEEQHRMDLIDNTILCLFAGILIGGILFSVINYISA